MSKARLHKSRSAAVQPRAMSQPLQAKPRYRTTNCKQYNAALKARGSLTIWLDKGMSWFAAACGKCGRRPQFSDAAAQFCLTFKNLFGLALRQATGFVQSLLALSGLLRPVPDFSTLCRRQRSLDVQVACRPSSGGLELRLDSTGPKFLGEGEWKCKKHGAERRRQCASCTSVSMPDTAGASHLRHLQQRQRYGLGAAIVGTSWHHCRRTSHC